MVGSKLVRALQKLIEMFSRKLRVSLWPSNPSTRCISKDTERMLEKHVCSLYTSGVFTTVAKWKPPEMDRCKKKARYI